MGRRILPVAAMLVLATASATQAGQPGLPAEPARRVEAGAEARGPFGGAWTSAVPAPDIDADLFTVDGDAFSGAENAIYAPGDDTVFVAYKRFQRSPYDPGQDFTPAELRVARSTDGGETWEVTVLDDDSPESGDLLEQSVAIDGDGAGTVVIAYFEQRDGLFDSMSLNVARSADGGATWTTSRVATRAGQFMDLKVVDASTVLLAADRAYSGYDEELRLYRSADGGASWTSSRVDLGSDWYVGLDRGNAGRIWLSHYDGGTTDLHTATAMSPTGPWAKRRVAGSPTDPHYTGLWSRLELIRGVVYVAYEDFQPSRGRSVIKVIRSADRGATWTRSTVDAAWGASGKLSLTAVPASPPGPVRLLLTYRFLIDDPELWGRGRVAASDDGGATWSVWTIPDPGYVWQYVDAAVPSPGVAYVSYQVTDADTGVHLLRIARLTPVP